MTVYYDRLAAQTCSPGTQPWKVQVSSEKAIPVGDETLLVVSWGGPPYGYCYECRRHVDPTYVRVTHDGDGLRMSYCRDCFCKISPEHEEAVILAALNR